MSIELKSISLPRTRSNPTPSKIYFLKIKKEDDEIKVKLTKDELILLYNQITEEGTILYDKGGSGDTLFILND